MENLLFNLYENINNPVVKIVVLCIVTDTIFGVIRAVKEKRFNSCFGIDGAIRKISMVLCIVFCAIMDIIIRINLVSLLPDTGTEWLESNAHISHIGIAEFFGILFIAYEVVSILKNMTLCGLPTKKVYEYIRKWLERYTDELPDNDEVKEMESGGGK
ncbi:MAG: phage holin family protein [Bacteroidales bacterium]|nr:phage holin family protein [Bacteroidales bacterium]